MGNPGRHFAVVSYRDIRHPEAGGAEVILYEIFRRLVRQGHRATFITGRWAGAARRDEIDGLRVWRVGNTYSFNFRAPAALRRLLREDPVDLVIEDVNKIPFFTLWCQHRAPVLAVVPHLFGTTVFQQAAFPLAVYVYLYERFIPLAYRRCLFSVLSETTRADLIARGLPREHLRVIRAGIDHDYYRPPERSGHPPGPVILYLGRIKKYKRIDLVIRALPAILEQVPGAEYWVVGEGDYQPVLEDLVERMNLVNHVHFLGFQTGAAKLETLARTRVLVYTSPKEGWGLSVIEANALGIPCVASHAPGLRESVRDGETGFLVPHGDLPALTQAILRLLQDDVIWEKMGRAAIDWAAQFDWDQSAQATLALAQEAIAEWKG